MAKSKDPRHVGYINRATRITTDGLQWIINTKSGDRWKTRSFVSSTKSVLLRCLRELGRTPDKRGSATLEKLPDTFAAWAAKN